MKSALQTENLETQRLKTVDSEFSNKKSLPDLFLDQVRARPDSTAAVYENQRLSYRELAESSSYLAAYLQHLGATVDECVGIFVEPSLELMTGVWGILFSGSAYLPLSPEYPDERLRYMIEDARVSIIFSQEKLKAKLTELAPPGTRIVTPKDAAEFAETHGVTEKNARCDDLRPNNLAYIIYTSGSTGKPKGVMIEHRSVVNQMHWLHIIYKLNQESVILQKTPMSFDAAQWEILAPICGSQVVVGEAGIYRDPERLIETVIRHQVTILQCVPTLLQALLDIDGCRDCKSLAQIFSGGEILSKNLALQCLETLPTCDLINLYGPTECTINASAFTINRHTVADGPNAISIGTPVYNTQYHILNSCHSPAAVGEIGELYIGGVQLARGYLRRPELTRDRFVDNPFSTNSPNEKLYRTGDLAHWNADGTVHFAGRADNQVKLRGFRVELDEIRLAIETHDWVKTAAVLIKNDSRTGFRNLIACVELNPREAALMDQGNHGSHHQSKESRLQIKAQLSNAGFRDFQAVDADVVVDLPGKTPTENQWRRVFARKSYRFFEGGAVRRSDIVQLLGRQIGDSGSRGLDSLGLADLGEILRYFGQFQSTERLLPKYGYASPGALYATQMYVELNNIDGIKPGYYYYHPLHHRLIMINGTTDTAVSQIKIHFVGKKQAIQPVYKSNIQEVLEIEAGHMLGLFDEILPTYRLRIGDGEYTPTVKDKLACMDEDYYLGTFALASQDGVQPDDAIDIYVQPHPGKIPGFSTGQYRYKDGCLEKISDEMILKKHVIAINQQVYDRASFGITLISRHRHDWMHYIALGRKLQHLQMNDLNLGFMSAGYSSKTGNDLPSAKRITSILNARGDEAGPSYFFVGGAVSDEQHRSEGMKEDLIHMKGPVELIKEDLLKLLPDYMMPNKVVVMDKLPLAANGKVDYLALEASDKTIMELVDRPFVAPRTQTEERIGEIWKKVMKWDAVSVQDDFFESGGNSLIAVRLISMINKEFQYSLPLQILFEAPTIEKLAHKINGDDVKPSSRLARLATTGSKNPIYCWPGLGGYPLNLRLLANEIRVDQPFYGVQAQGINQGETPFSTIKEMAAEDIKAIQRIQASGPYTLWGYSFGARLAFEAAFQLEQAGEHVNNLFLIAPGSPKVRARGESVHGNEATFDNPAFVTILFSVFAHSITDPALDECLRVAKNEASFASFICARYKNLDLDLVNRIVSIVRQTYEFKYSFHELTERQIRAPLTVFKAKGDDYSFIDNSEGFSIKASTVINLEADHYSMLKSPDICELVTKIRSRLGLEGKPEKTKIQSHLR